MVVFAFNTFPEVLKPYFRETPKGLTIFYCVLSSCVPYVPDPENTALLRCAVDLFRKFKQYPQALRFAMQLNDMKLIEDIFVSCKDL